MNKISQKKMANVVKLVKGRQKWSTRAKKRSETAKTGQMCPKGDKFFWLIRSYP